MSAKMLLVCGTKLKFDVLVLAIIIWNATWCACVSHHEYEYEMICFMRCILKWIWHMKLGHYYVVCRMRLVVLMLAAILTLRIVCDDCFLGCSILNCMWHMEIRLWSCLSVQRIYDHSTLHDMSWLLALTESLCEYTLNCNCKLQCDCQEIDLNWRDIMTTIIWDVSSMQYDYDPELPSAFADTLWFLIKRYFLGLYQ